MKNHFSNPWLLFAPYLLLFILLVFRFHSDEMVGDESRYVGFAENLLRGFYSPKSEVNLWNGSGYPILLMPFVGFKLPWIAISLLNAVLHFLSIILFFKTVSHFASRKMAVFFTFLWATYYLAYQEIALIMTECLTMFLISAIGFCLTKYFFTEQKKFGVAAGFLLGYLVLT